MRTGSASGTIVGTRSFTVIDTSTTPAPTFSLGSVSNMNEGASQTISVSTTNFGSGTVYFSIDGSGDFTSHSGSVSISNNSGSFTITSVADQTTEGNETKTLRLRTGSTSGTQVDSATFTLIDTSGTPAYSFSASNMNEGASQTITVTTSNVANGTILYFSIDGNPSSDMSVHNGSFTINNNSGSFTISTIADATTEGTETKVLRVRTGSTSGTTVASDTFNILDTSTASGGGGSGGGGTGGATTGTANYGVAVFGPNGTSVVFGSNLRTQNSVFSTTLSATSGITYGPFSVANANDTSKIQITVDYQVPSGSSNTVSGSQIILTKSANSFTFRHTAGGTKTFVITAIKIA